MKLIWSRLSLVVVAFSALQVQAEVLGHISDETATPILAEPANAQANDRRIIYRVICSPDGEALPDCEQTYHDTETVVQPVKQQEELVSPEVEPEQAAEFAQSKKASSKKMAGNKKKPARKSRKTSKSKKKTAKKSTAKKNSSSSK